MATSIRMKVKEVVEAIANPTSKVQTTTIEHPNIYKHHVTVVVQKHHDSVSVSMGIQGPVHHVRAKLVLEHVHTYSCSYHIVDWVNTQVDTFIRDLTKVLLREMQLAKLIPLNDTVV